MCLGIPGQIVELLSDTRAPAPRRRQRRRPDRSTSACSRTRTPAPGDWVLIHVGFAMLEDRRGADDLPLFGLVEDDGLRSTRTRWTRLMTSRISSDESPNELDIFPTTAEKVN